MPEAQPVAADEVVTAETLGAALDDLMKAADTADLLNKGGKVDDNRVEHSGRIDEDGKLESGGRGTESDTGGIDKMMIGKLADLDFSADQIAVMSAALVGKAKGGDEDEDESMEGYMRHSKSHAEAYMKEHGSMKGYMGMPHKGSPVHKSGDAGEGEPLVKSEEAYREDARIKDFVDGNDFFEGYIAKTAEQIDSVNVSLRKGFGEQATVNSGIAGALFQMGTLLKSQAAVSAELGKRLGIVESTPNAPKGVTTAADALNKSLPGEAGAGGEPLKKHEICSTLSYMNLVKHIKEIDGESTAHCIGMLEGGNQASPAVLQAVHDFHQANPNLSDAARAYQ